jgi:3-methylcrotonyl-CoA carboxylase alpha subunit
MNKLISISKILVANRSEIAVRIMKTARKLGIRSVAVYSEIDRDSLHVSYADEAWCIGDKELCDTYLNIDKIISVAKAAKADAIHPGYGFLAENPLFVEACEKSGIIFIGPDSNSMKVMGNKIEARDFAIKNNIPVTPGLTGTITQLVDAKNTITFPVLIKAAAGGGGKGMQIIHNEADLEEALRSASRQAKAYFDDETVYLEKYIINPRHIEVQVLGDNHGNVIHLFERECSIQRRYQKIIEESPSPTLTPEVRAKMGITAVKLAKAIGYRNAGTVEFLVDTELNFYFLEMNTRIQVEHPVTEFVTGIDIVEEQINIASGRPLRLKQDMIRQMGHAIECRIYAEDPSNNFLPSPGTMTLYQEPSGKYVRIDTGITSETVIKSAFDPMISKLITWGKNRESAADAMVNALDNYIIHGIQNNISYLAGILKSDAYRSNAISTGFCDVHTVEINTMIEAGKKKMASYLPAIACFVRILTGCSDYSSTFKKHYSIWESVGYWRNHVSIRFRYDEEVLEIIAVKLSKNNIELIIGNQHYHTKDIVNEGNRLCFTLDNKYYTAYISDDKSEYIFISICGHLFRISRSDVLPVNYHTSALDKHGADGDITAPMPGKVIRIKVDEGALVKKGDILLIIEAMKMENNILANRNAKVAKINVSINQMVEASTPLLELTDVE